MNRAYRLIWNIRHGGWTVAAETAKGRSKASSRPLGGAVVASLLLGAAFGAGSAAAACVAPDGIDGASDAPATCVADAPSIASRSIGVMAGGWSGGNGISIAYGTASATATANGDIAIGGNAAANSGVNGNGNFSVAIGDTARAAVTNGLALGARATASNANSVALGARSIADRDDSVSVGSNTQQRQIIYVANGTLDSDAATVGQLRGAADALGTIIDADGNFVAPSYSVGGQTVNSVSGAIASLDGQMSSLGAQTTDVARRVTQSEADIARNSTDITTINSQLGDLSNGTIGMVQQAGVGADLTVGANTDGQTVNFAGTAGERKLTGLLNGTVAAGSTDAVTGDQLHTTNEAVDRNATDIASTRSAVADLGSDVQQLGGDVSNLGVQMTDVAGRVTQNEVGIAKNAADIGRNTTDIAAISSQLGDLSSGTIGLVQQAGAGADLTVGANTDGQAVNFAGTAGERKLTGLLNGTVAAGSTDAVTGDQLHTTNEVVDRNATDIASTRSAVVDLGNDVQQLGGDVSNLGVQMTDVTGRVSQNEVGIAKNAADIGKNTTDIATINSQLGDLSGGTIGLVQQAGAGADLTVGANTDGHAVNFAGTAGERKLTGLLNGTVAAGSTDAVTGDQLHTVAVDVGNLDGRVTSNESSIAQIRSDMGSGSIGLVRQAAAGAELTVGADTDGASVNFAGKAGERKLTGLANGTVEAGSTDAVTGDQLHAVAADVGSLDQRVTSNESSITQIRSDMNSGQIGMVQQDRTTGAITVAAHAGGTSVDFAGTHGARVLTGVANGVEDSDAVTVAQLKAAGLIDPAGKALGALTYDDLTLSSATLGGVGGTVLNNVAPGLIASGSMQAVNGGQLYAFQQDIESRFDALDGRVGNLEENGGGGGSGGGTPGGSVPSPGTGSGSVAVGAGADASGSNSTAVGQDTVASAENGTALGQGSSATGSNGTAAGQGSSASGQNGAAFGQNANASGNGSTALGQNANATGSNSVALGAGSVADRDNAVSVGSAGNERQITNVAAGTAPTDAVNLQQMNNSVRSARQDAMGGVAAAMAVAGLPQSTQPGRTFVAMAGSTYGGEYGSALGVSYMTRDGKWTIKASANTSSRGEVGAVVGGGFYW